MKSDIHYRIKRALDGTGGRITYHELMRRVFPENEYPKAYKGATKGGPPGCAMAFGAALREMGLSFNLDRDRVYGLFDKRPTP